MRGGTCPCLAPGASSRARHGGRRPSSLGVVGGLGVLGGCGLGVLACCLCGLGVLECASPHESMWSPTRAWVPSKRSRVCFARASLREWAESTVKTTQRARARCVPGARRDGPQRSWGALSAAHPAPERGAKNGSTTHPSTLASAEEPNSFGGPPAPRHPKTYDRGAQNQRGARRKAPPSFAAAASTLPARIEHAGAHWSMEPSGTSASKAASLARPSWYSASDALSTARERETAWA